MDISWLDYQIARYRLLPQQYTVHAFTACTLYCWVWSFAACCDLTPCCLCLVRFDYCRFIELDYVPMETGYMVSMRPTKGYAPTKSPTKGYTSTRSPDRHSRSTNSPSTPRSRSVPLLSSWSVLFLWRMGMITLCFNDVTLWKKIKEFFSKHHV